MLNNKFLLIVIILNSIFLLFKDILLRFSLITTGSLKSPTPFNIEFDMKLIQNRADKVNMINSMIANIFEKNIFLLHRVSRFTEFHKKATLNIISGNSNDNYPFFKDDRFNTMEINIKNIEKHVNNERNIIIEDKHNLQTIISDISHQVKTPIANIKMINEILLSRKLSQEQSYEFIKSMDEEVNKLDFLMQSMITISLLETEILKFNNKILPIYDTILSSLNSSMSLINKKEVDIEVICSEDILVKHDPKWTAEAIYNVINNAAKFSPDKGTIIIKVLQGQFYTSISIKDNGAGISERNMDQIFKKFYSKNNENGSGIGLHLTERIIKGQNGYINVKSELNRGSEFIYNSFFIF